MTYQERLKQYGPMDSVPFTDRESYLAWATAWKKHYAAGSAKIREYRVFQRLCRQQREHLHSTSTGLFEGSLTDAERKIWGQPSDYWRSVFTWKSTATAMLIERHQSKVSAQQQWEAAQEIKKAA